MTRQSYSLDEIKGMLLDRRHDVAQHYAPPAQGAYTDRGQYYTLNPGRPDRRVGSFVVWLDGPKMGRWTDFATGQHGDLIDLIALSLGCTLPDAIREARSYLGLQADAPEDVARRKAAAERAKALAAEARRKDAEARARKRRAALALWLSGQERIRATPVEAYLRDTRAIDLAQLGHQPRALRYHPACAYRHVDAATGEIIEGSYPAMLALAVNARGEAVACHRTWLAIGPDGRWGKAPVPKAKKVLGDYAGASIHLWRGLAPGGKRARPLAEAEPGSHVYIAEGIEDALSAVMVLPSARVICAINLTNFGGIELPAAVAEVTLIADQDEGPEARAALDRAVAAHAAAGRVVRVWQNHDGGKDLNDALRAARERQQKNERAEDAADGETDGPDLR